jgi:hypothetical protein
MGQPPRGRRLLPRRTLRLRLTVLYCSLFLLCALVMLAITNGVGSTSKAATRPAGIAHAHGGGQAARAHAATSHQFLIGSVIAFCVVAVLSLGLAWVAAGRALRPLREMTAATRRISAESLDERLALAGPDDEMKDLADTIDGLLARLEHAFAAQRGFVANASHELRTPLATMRAALDVAAAKPGGVPPQTLALADRVRGELDRVDGLLDGLLLLAKTRHGALPGMASVSLGGLVLAALDARAADIAARELAVQAEVGAQVVHGNRVLLSRLADNVLDNAIRHNPPGGWIAVSARAEAGMARLEIGNGGPVLSQGQVDRLARPFSRLGADRTGSDDGAGLGLSIVAAIVQAHGGALHLRARPDGGLQVSLELPLAGGPA